MSVLVVESCGPATSIQDAGRLGWQRFGLGPCGAMDREALAIANMLVGNEAGVAALEFVMLGGRFRCEGGPVRLALAGAEMPMAIDGRGLDGSASFTLEPGAVLAVGTAKSGIFACLAIAGGLGLAPALGSLSFHLRSGIGGVDGRLVAAGDRLPLARAETVGAELALASPYRSAEGPIRLMLGPQDDYFAPSAIETFLGNDYVVSPQADRMGYRLTGPKIEHAKGFNIISDGIATGAIQVPGAGEPIVLLADRQTTGGYPKIATIISADLPRIAFRRPGDKVRFAAVTRSEAVAAARERAVYLASLRASLREAGEASLDSERLLGLNLVGGFVSGGD